MSELTTRLLDPWVDGMDLVQLFEDVFGATVTPHMWQWKYVPPWTERYYCWVARIDDRTIGYAGAVPLPGQIHGKRVPFFQLADFMVHPDHRLKHDFFGICSRTIVDEIVASHPRHLIYGFSTHRAFLWMKKLGVCDTIRREQTRYVRGGAMDARFSFEEADWPAEELDAIWSDLGDEHPVSLVRDGKYLRWRYLHHPVNSYRLLRVIRGKKATGWCVISGDTPGKNGRPPETPVVDALLPRAVHGEVISALAAHLETDLMLWVPESHTPYGAETKDSGTHVYHFKKGCDLSTKQLQDELYYTMGDVDWW